MKLLSKTKQNGKPSKWRKYFKKFGVVGFLFFFIKGLVWIAIFVFGAKSCSSFIG